MRLPHSHCPMLMLIMVSVWMSTKLNVPSENEQPVSI